MTLLETLHSITSPSNHLCGLAWVKGKLWYSDGKESKLYRVDPEKGEVDKIIQIPNVNASLSYYDRYLWQVTSKSEETQKTVTRIDPKKGLAVEVLELGPDSEYVAGVEAVQEGIWVSLEEKARLQLRQISTNIILRDFPVEPRIAGVVLAGDIMYYCEFTQKLLVTIDPLTGSEIHRYGVEGNPTGLTWDGQHIWYNDYTRKKIRKIKQK